MSVQERAREAIASVGLTDEQLEILRPEAQARVTKAAGLPTALVQFDKAKRHLAEHTETVDEAQAALDAIILAGGASGGLLGQRKLIGQMVRDGAPEPTYLPTPTLGEGLFYSKQSFIISGHKKSGKSFAMASAANDCVSAGVPVVYIDLENGEELFAERMAKLGADPDELDKFFHYVPFPTGLTLDGLRDELEDIAEALPGAFVIVDSLRGLLRKLSPAGRPLNPNDATDVELVCGPIMEAVKSTGITCGIIDHAKKSGSDSDEYSTAGSGGKEAAVDAVYFWTKVTSFSQDVASEVKIAATSDRRGRLDFERSYRVGGQGPDGTFGFQRLSQSETGSHGRVLLDVKQLLGDAQGEYFTKTEIRQGVKGDNHAVDGALQWLIDADDEPVYADKIGGQAHPKYIFDPSRGAPDGLDY